MAAVSSATILEILEIAERDLPQENVIDPEFFQKYFASFSPCTSYFSASKEDYCFVWGCKRTVCYLTGYYPLQILGSCVDSFCYKMNSDAIREQVLDKFDKDFTRSTVLVDGRMIESKEEMQEIAADLFAVDNKNYEKYLSIFEQRVIFDLKNEIYEHYQTFFSTDQVQLVGGYGLIESEGLSFRVSTQARKIEVCGSQYLVTMKDNMPDQLLRKISMKLVIDLTYEIAWKTWGSKDVSLLTAS